MRNMSGENSYPSNESLYERILSDPDSRDAYFNTTSAQLFADPEELATSRVVEALESGRVAFIFSADEFLARPVLQTEFGQFVGESEILRAIARLVIPSITPSAA